MITPWVMMVKNGYSWTSLAKVLDLDYYLTQWSYPVSTVTMSLLFDQPLVWDSCLYFRWHRPGQQFENGLSPNVPQKSSSKFLMFPDVCILKLQVSTCVHIFSQVSNILSNFLSGNRGIIGAEDTRRHGLLPCVGDGDLPALSVHGYHNTQHQLLPRPSRVRRHLRAVRCWWRKLALPMRGDLRRRSLWAAHVSEL